MEESVCFLWFSDGVEYEAHRNPATFALAVKHGEVFT